MNKEPGSSCDRQPSLAVLQWVCNPQPSRERRGESGQLRCPGFISRVAGVTQRLHRQPGANLLDRILKRSVTKREPN
ncbi:UNVERIFIED_CONTAM: hypothetical protein FKN15_024281 [Acipenser sinensis]